MIRQLGVFGRFSPRCDGPRSVPSPRGRSGRARSSVRRLPLDGGARFRGADLAPGKRALVLLAALAIALTGLGGEAAAGGIMRSEVAPMVSFFSAVKSGDLPGVREHLSKGANPNGIDDRGKTPLVYATVAGNVDLVAELLKSGARPDIQDEVGNAPLVWAAEQGEVEIATMLLDAGASPNQANHQGQTPLIKAAQRGQKDVIRLLIERGANLHKRDFTGRTALEWAEESGKRSAADILRKAGG